MRWLAFIAQSVVLAALCGAAQEEQLLSLLPAVGALDALAGSCPSVLPRPLRDLYAADDEGAFDDTPAAPYAGGVTVFHSSVEESSAEWSAFRSLPTVLTMVNPALGEGRVKGTPRADPWAASTAAVMGLAATHPRNNRTGCMAWTRAAVAAPQALYVGLLQQDSGHLQGSQYVAYVQRALVHDGGSVLLTVAAPSDPGCVLHSQSSCDSDTVGVRRRWPGQCAGDLRRVGLSMAELFRDATDGRLADKMFHGPYARFVRNTGGQAPVPMPSKGKGKGAASEPVQDGGGGGRVLSLREFTTARPRLLPQVCGMNMTALHDQLLGPNPNLSPALPAPHVHHSVFVLSAPWDHNYHHFLIDSLVRAARHLPFLQSRPAVKLHIRRFEQFCKKERYIRGGLDMRARLWGLLGLARPDNEEAEVGGRQPPRISDRVVSGTVLARHVYFPKSTECNWSVGAAYSVRMLANLLLWQARLEHGDGGGGDAAVEAELTSVRTAIGRFRGATADSSGGESLMTQLPQFYGSKTHGARAASGGRSGLILLQHRHCAEKKTCQNDWREWPNATLDIATQQMTAELAVDDRAFEKRFGLNSKGGSAAAGPDSLTVLRSDDRLLMQCLPCQLHRLYSGASILVGLHGAGLTNMIFMPPGGLVVEIVGKFDGRMLPVCGYHGSLAALLGLHHYVFYYDWKAGERIDFADLTRRVMLFYALTQERVGHGPLKGSNR